SIAAVPRPASSGRQSEELAAAGRFPCMEPVHLRHRTNVLNSWALVVESKRLLLCRLERRRELLHTPEDLVAIKRLRNELELAEHMRMANRSAASSAMSSVRLRDLYRNLIQRATACSENLASTAPLLPPSDRLSTAVTVQMLDELVAQWREAAA